MDTFISYEGLPVNSGGAHSLSKKPIDKIYFETVAFLQTFANCEDANETELTFYSSQNKSYKAVPILWSLTKIFGIPSHNSWDLGSVKQHFYAWKLKRSDTQKGFEILEKYRHLPQNQYGPIVLSFKWQFHFVEKNTKRALSGQDKLPIIDSRQQNSQIYLRLGQRPTISVWFAFPFTSLDENASNYISSLINHLPFKPSEKHWRIWRQSNHGNWRPEKLDINAS